MKDTIMMRIFFYLKKLHPILQILLFFERSAIEIVNYHKNVFWASKLIKFIFWSLNILVLGNPSLNVLPISFLWMAPGPNLFCTYKEEKAIVVSLDLQNPHYRRQNKYTSIGREVYLLVHSRDLSRDHWIRPSVYYRLIS